MTNRLALLLIFMATFDPVLASSRRPEAKEEKGSVQTAPTAPSAPATAIPAEEKSAPEWNYLTVFLALHPDGEPPMVLDFLRRHPDLPVCLIFPPGYFDEQTRRPLISQFAALQSSKTAEIALVLDNAPNLPLLNDLNEAGETVRKWGVEFSWPEDVAAQIARGSAKYQKRWSALPTGFFPPHLNLSEPVVNTLKKFRINWVLGRPNEAWGVRYYGGTALIVPPSPPVVDELSIGAKDWAEQMAEWSVRQPFALIDTTQLEDPKAEQLFLAALAKKASNRTIITAEQLVETLKNEFELPKTAAPFVNNYSSWINTPQQKRAWTALADARAVIDRYQSSGRATLQRLDAAIEEMCIAESGEFLLNLGSGDAANSALSERVTEERNFLATLANIYRLCETPVPANLSSWFAVRTWQKSPPKTAQSDGPFFIEGPDSLTWNDPKEDDKGAGKYVYPTGAYPKGLFDLKELTISWTESNITVTAAVLENFPSKPTPIGPLVDVYIDVNRLPDAGNTRTLRRRGNASIMREAAWEYAVTLSINSGILYQAVPGGNPRFLAQQAADRQGKSFSVTFPRSLLRGNPKNWRLSAGLMGTENTRRPEEQLPVSILVNATDKNFGGASGGQAAPFVDILSPTIDDQEQRIDAHAQGGQLTLPYVESQ